MGVPLFVMLTGALLLAPGKQDEPLGVFFKKRFSRIGFPFLFWGALYFIWDFYVENQPFTQAFLIKRFPVWTILHVLVPLYANWPVLSYAASARYGSQCIAETH